MLNNKHHMQKVLSFVSLILNQKSSNIPPVKVGEYSLETIIGKNQKGKRYATGIYKNGKKKVFIKTWSGRLKNFDYFSLKNESKISKIIYKYSSSLQLEDQLNVPKVVAEIKNKNQYSIIFEYINGNLASTLPVSKQVEIINKVLNGLSTISTKISEIDKASIPSRSVFWHLEVFVPKLIKSKLPNKAKWQLLTAVLWSYMSLIPVSSTEKKIAHGDLLPQNIIVNKKKIYLIDFGQTSFTIPDYDLAYISTQPNLSSLIAKLLPHGLVMTQTYMSKLIASVSAVSTETVAMQNYFMQCVCA